METNNLKIAKQDLQQQISEILSEESINISLFEYLRHSAKFTAVVIIGTKTLQSSRSNTADMAKEIARDFTSPQPQNTTRYEL